MERNSEAARFQFPLPARKANALPGVNAEAVEGLEEAAADSVVVAEAIAADSAAVEVEAEVTAAEATKTETHKKHSRVRECFLFYKKERKGLPSVQNPSVSHADCYAD
jgi:hypothetical protein